MTSCWYVYICLLLQLQWNTSNTGSYNLVFPKLVGTRFRAQAKTIRPIRGKFYRKTKVWHFCPKKYQFDLDDWYFARLTRVRYISIQTGWLAVHMSTVNIKQITMQTGHIMWLRQLLAYFGLSFDNKYWLCLLLAWAENKHGLHYTLAKLYITTTRIC